MKLGSVKFFKRLILCGLALMIIIPSGLCIDFGIQNRALTEKLEKVSPADQTQTGKKAEDTTAVSVITAGSPTDTELAKIISQRETASGLLACSLDYQELYPEMYIDHDWEFEPDNTKAVYLTFDDGPSSVTPKILDMLRLYGVKATFFVVYDPSPEAADLLRRMVAEGHTIGVHTTTHQYRQIYSSVESYLTDFQKTAAWIEKETGVKPTLFRFPGGSVNTYNLPISEMLISEMLRRGYLYFDWNVSSGDASTSVTTDEIVSNVLSGVAARDGEKAVVLMHDGRGKKDIQYALPHIIESLEASGKELLPLTNTVKPICFDY
jgi:peptidoglycan-N-acetylglucosamine deacetylase